MDGKRKWFLILRWSSILKLRVTDLEKDRLKAGRFWCRIFFVTNELWIIFASNNWSEITEFPAVLVNLSTEEIVSEFHEFVRPTESPELSDFCKKLTHLEKKDLSKEKTLEEVMIDFELWTKDVQKEHDLYFYTPKGI